MRMAALAMALILSGCAPDVGAPPEVVWSVGGCFSLLEGGRCYTRAEGRVVLWVQDEAQAHTLRLNGMSPEHIEGGWRWTLPIDRPVTLRVKDSLGRPWVELAVQNTADEWRDALMVGVQCLEPSSDFDAHERAFYASGRGRCGAEPDRLQWLQTAIEGHRDRGDTLRFGWDQATWAQQNKGGRQPPGGLWLPSATALEARYLWLYRHGMAANAAGNLADAQRFLADARQAALILHREDGGKWLGAIDAAAIANLLEAGRLQAATQETDRLLQEATAPGTDLSCARLMAASNRVWLTAMGAPRSPAAMAVAQAVQAAWAAGDELCPNVNAAQWQLMVNTAAAALAQGELSAAAAHLAPVLDQPAPDPLSGQWLQLVRADLALATDHPEAVAGLLGPLPDQQPPTPTTIHALRRRALAQQAQGNSADALATLTALQGVLPAVVARAPLSGGRGALVDSASQAATLHAGLLLEQGATADALAVLRRQRRLALLGLQQADLAAEAGGVGPLSWARLREYAAFSTDTGDLQAWERDTGSALGDSGGPGLPDELSMRVEAALQDSVQPAAAPLPDIGATTLLVLAQPAHRAVHLWWRLGDGPVRQRQLPHAPAAAPPLARLVAALAPELSQATAVAWLPMGAARSWPLAAAPFQGAPLGTRLPVATHLDLRPARARPLDRPAIVVADPSENLASARKEGAEVAQKLATRFDTHAYVGAQADKRTVARALADGVGLAHFAGHATFADDGWDAAIHLADEERIAVWELLGLAQPPQVVSMTACESSRSEAGNAERLGLAQALIVAGSEVVVAADVPVPDDLSRTFGRAWAAALAEGATPQTAWVTATRTTWQAHPDGPWWAFRLWTP